MHDDDDGDDDNDDGDGDDGDDWYGDDGDDESDYNDARCMMLTITMIILVIISKTMLPDSNDGSRYDNVVGNEKGIGNGNAINC